MAKNKIPTYRLGELELKWWSMKECHGIIFARRSYSERSRRPASKAKNVSVSLMKGHQLSKQLLKNVCSATKAVILNTNLMSTELIALLWPMISPREFPASAANTWPNLETNHFEHFTTLLLQWSKYFGISFSVFRQLILGSTHFSLPSPPTTILLLSPSQAKSLIGPPRGWNSFFRMCSLLMVSQIRTLPELSEERIQICCW